MTGNDFSKVRAFIKPQIGSATYKTNIRIADPENEDDCKPLDKRTSQRYSDFVYGGEVGMEFALGTVTSSFSQKLFFTASYLQGFRPFEYVNIKYMQDGMVDHSSHVASNDTREIKGEFVNVTTQAVHEHKIAELYRTNMSLIGINVGYLINF